MTGDLVDTSIPQNEAFMLKCKAKAVKNGKDVGAVKSEGKRSTTKKEGKPAPDPKVLREQRERQDALYNLDMEKKAIDIRKAKRESELLEARQQKLNGELIPTELIKTLFVQHTENIKTAYTDGSENLIVILAQRKQMSSTEVSELKKDFIGIINKAIDGAIDTTKRTLNNIIKEYSQKRGVGQHD